MGGSRHLNNSIQYIMNPKKTEDGKLKKEIDWTKTKALAVRGNYIWLNVKGRDKYGIVEPEDQYALEEQLMQDLYAYRDEYGHRVVYLVMPVSQGMLSIRVIAQIAEDIMKIMGRGQLVDGSV